VIDELKIENEKSKIIDILVDVKFCASKGEARRAIEAGGVKLDGVKISDINFEIQLEKEDKKLLQLGKRKFVYLVK
jgi:tyrosyl-tRNA synthetase